MDEHRPGYYAIIPADVRYDDSIPPNAKLLYGEISALIGADGFCFASNQYFSDLYGMTEVSVSRLISKLEKAGHVTREVDRDPAGQIVSRKLYLRVSIPDVQPLNKIVNTSQQKCKEGINNNVKDTNTSITDIYKENIKESSGETSSKKKRTSTENFDPAPLFVEWIGQALPDSPADSKNALYLALLRFSENRTAIKHPMRSKGAVTSLCNRLMRMSDGHVDLMVEMLDRATSSGWQSVYPLNDDMRSNARPSDGQGRTWEEL